MPRIRQADIGLFIAVADGLGIPWATQSFFDTLHKQKLKDLEKAIANKFINSVAVLKLGDKDHDDDVIKNKKRRVYSGVKTGLERNTSVTGITVIGIPYWTELDFPEIKTDALDPKKFESIDNDVDAADLHLLLSPEIQIRHAFRSGRKAFINKDKCAQCRKCIQFCRYDAICLLDREIKSQ